ncbi:protein indeterminate-domain 7 [Argentina anserina]|uniref:protein indeterminate-domain 7 n=1 Tax=Argentina anserina TaxID=57926 RepID=UPI0021766F13|nr:protein indeterminate-domain 7 [Potentilla anserina]XP_050379526.1 protein indeterminate-domain 7 [Potentilla anserina]XP_050379527.1 protein indeterminate-domain 7 [Potentilla anserina]XP_050379528.1 protein indeterminate-domain 7 [Potentilla anserina]
MKALQFQQQQQVDENMSNLTSASGDQASVSSGNRSTEIGTSNFNSQQYFPPPLPQANSQGVKRKRNQPGNPDPDAEVIALSPKTLMATNRFICEICNKGFQRDQNLQLHRRGHNLPWKLKQRSSKEIRKKVYVCPEASCVHHDPSRALGDLTGIKKHFFRKHGEKKWKCEKCSKKYAVQSDWKAHSKTCGTREYRCDCGTLFSRRDSFITHRAFCDALAEESARAINPTPLQTLSSPPQSHQINLMGGGGPHHNLNFNSHGHDLHAYNAFMKKEHNNDQQIGSFSSTNSLLPPWLASGPPPSVNSIFSGNQDHHHHHDFQQNLELGPNPNPSLGSTLPQFQVPAAAALSSPPHMSATALLQKAAQMGATMSGSSTTSGSVSVPAGIMPRTHHGGHVSDFGGHVSAATNGGVGGGGGGGAHLQQQQQATSLLHDMMNSLSSGTGFEGTSFEDAFGGIFAKSRDGSRTGGADENGGGGGGEGLTRDFLGLKAISHSDMMLNIAGLGNCVSNNNSSSTRDSQQNNQVPQKPNWQG